MSTLIVVLGSMLMHLALSFVLALVHLVADRVLRCLQTCRHPDIAVFRYSGIGVSRWMDKEGRRTREVKPYDLLASFDAVDAPCCALLPPILRARNHVSRLLVNWSVRLIWHVLCLRESIAYVADVECVVQITRVFYSRVLSVGY